MSRGGRTARGEQSNEATSTLTHCHLGSSFSFCVHELWVSSCQQQHLNKRKLAAIAMSWMEKSCMERGRLAVARQEVEKNAEAKQPFNLAKVKARHSI